MTMRGSMRQTMCVAMMVFAGLQTGCQHNSQPMTPSQKQAGQKRLEPLRAEAAEKPDSEQAAFDLAKELYFQSAVGDREALDRSLKMFQELREAKPDDARMRAYLGSAILADAADKTPLPTLLPQVNRGLDLLDAAGQAAPDDPEVRLVRGLTLFNVPKMFDRREEAEADLAWVVERMDQLVAEKKIDPRPAASALFSQGKVLQQRGDEAGARAMWERAVKMAPQSKGGKSAARRLAASAE